MTNNKHTIGTLHFDLETYNEKHALEIQQSVSGFGRREIPDIMEESLSRTGIDDSVAIIDKLEIDLGEIAFEEFQTKFLSLFKNRFSEKLSEIRFDLPHEKSDDVTIHDKIESEIEILKYFLLTGRIPWYLESTPTDLQVIFKKLVDPESEAFMLFVRDHISNKFFLERLVYQFPETILIRLFENVFERQLDEHFQFIKQLLPILERSMIFATQISYLRHFMLITLLQTEVETGGLPAVDFEEHFLIKFAARIDVGYQELLKQIDELIIELKKKSLIEIDVDLEIKIGELLKKHITATKDEIVLKTKAGEETVEEVFAKPEEDEEPKSYFISNAGLVLLHTFFAELFRKTGLIINKEFIDEQAIHKAIHLSQYAVFGNKARPEHLLILNKILCGYPLEKTIPIRIKLSKTEKSEATRMVNAAIKHWSALKNTSAEGFRNSFLQRNGLLKQTENGWQLLVERKGLDVLLNHIPWGYRIVKLPWMEKMIVVEW